MDSQKYDYRYSDMLSVTTYNNKYVKSWAIFPGCKAHKYTII